MYNEIQSNTVYYSHKKCSVVPCKNNRFYYKLSRQSIDSRQEVQQGKRMFQFLRCSWIFNKN